MTTGERIKLERERRGWSQEYLAKLLGYSGKSAVSKIETSGDKVTLKTIEKLATVFNCTKFYLMGIESDDVTEFNREETQELSDKRLIKIIRNYTLLDDYFKEKMLSHSKHLLDTQRRLED